MIYVSVIVLLINECIMCLEPYNNVIVPCPSASEQLYLSISRADV